jgi:hypothetical protein
MTHTVYQIRQRAHAFGDDQPAGWLPPHAPEPPRAPRSTVLLDISIEERDDGGFVLRWTGPGSKYSGDHRYENLAYAEHAAEELFGVTRADWESAV